MAGGRVIKDGIEIDFPLGYQPWKDEGDKNWRTLAFLTQPSAVDYSALPGGSPITEGLCYLILTGEANAEKIAIRDEGVWVLVDPREGMRFYVEADGGWRQFDGATWVLDDASVPPLEAFGVALSDVTTALVVGASVEQITMPYAFELEAVFVEVKTAPTGAAIHVDINEAGASILSGPLVIDATEFISTTGTSPPTITDTTLAQYAKITFDIDQVGSTIAGAGLKAWLVGRRIP